MCGIIAYAGDKDAASILLDGLRSLEYRGYDSAGLAVSGTDGSIAIVKCAGRVDALATRIDGHGPRGSLGIAHTRWATHGEVNDVNAHPHVSSDGDIAIVHNGIVENYAELRRELIEAGYTFRSATDSEVIVHLITREVHAGADLREAVRSAARRIEGAAAIVAARGAEPDRIVGVRLGNAGGIVVGLAEGANLLASDLLALLPHTKRIAYLEDGEIVTITPGSASFITLDGKPLVKPVITTDSSFEAAQKNGHAHFMAKEIAEQPAAVTSAMRMRLDFDTGAVQLPGFSINDADLRNLTNVVLVGMGSSMHAAMVGRHLIEGIARIPSSVDNASELRYRDPVLDEHTLLVAITQSGETADTLAAMEEARSKGARIIALVETEGSQATRIAETVLPLRAGSEVAVASTKTMMNALVALCALALYLGARRGDLTAEAQRRAVAELSRLPALLGGLVDDAAGGCRSVAERVKDRQHMLFLGRGAMHAIAMEGALKMKEVAYVHAEGYAAGEMKHGVNALISDAMPTIALAPAGPLYQKMLSNVNEVKARGGDVIALVTEGDREVSEIADEALFLPAASDLLTPMLALVPLQLLAYHVSVARGLDPDKPRNLAKTVTVE